MTPGAGASRHLLALLALAASGASIPSIDNHHRSRRFPEPTRPAPAQPSSARGPRPEKYPGQRTAYLVGAHRGGAA